MDKESQLIPYTLLIGGVAGALYIACLAAMDPSVEYCVSFAIACIVAAIGYSEVEATAEFNDTFRGNK